MAPSALTLDGVEFGDMTLQSVMRAIDNSNDQNFDNLFDISMEGLSILDDSFLNKIEQIPHTGNDNRLRRRAPDQTEENYELWESLFNEQKVMYETKIKKLSDELSSLKRQTKTNEGEGIQLSEAKEKWSRVHKILDGYFAEYNLQI